MSHKRRSVFERLRLSDKRYQKVWKRLTVFLSVFVIFGTVSALMLPAITLNKDACTLEEHLHTAACWPEDQVQLICGDALDVHTHSDACYDGEALLCAEEDFVLHTHDDFCWYNGKLRCSLPEWEEHRHEDGCYALHTHTEACGEGCTLEEGQQALTCTLPELAAHTHDDSCYELQPAPEGAEEPTQEPVKVLVCGQTQLLSHQHGESCWNLSQISTLCGLQEHTHISECFPDAVKGLETQEQWEAALPQLTGNWSQDLVLVAQSQLGYTESQENTGLDAQGNIWGYTRYGQWLQDPYGDWRGRFLAFCLHYAGIPEEVIPRGNDLSQWQTALTEFGIFSGPDQAPQLGDILFLDRDADGAPDAVGILAQPLAETPIAGTPGETVTLEGGYNGAVAQVGYDAATLLGSVSLAGAETKYAQDILAATGKQPYSLTHRGEDYTVNVAYGPEAALPKNVTLAVREIFEGETLYDEYMAQLCTSVAPEDIVNVRLFDVAFLDALGQEIQPAVAVEMEILYDTALELTERESVNMVHLDQQTGPEHLAVTHLEEEDGSVVGIQYSQDSFSPVAMLIVEDHSGAAGNAVVLADDRATDSSLRFTNATNTSRKYEDAVTLDRWKERFAKEVNTTEYAGGVYMDKSVFSGSATFGQNGGTTTVTPTDENSFLVGLSTMASTMSVYGKESAPTDVMFILDMSSSMYWIGGKYDTVAVSAMVDAVNKNIAHLHSLNPENRVGVAIYYGGDTTDDQSLTSHSRVMLPLGRYTANSSGQYLRITGGGGGADSNKITLSVTATKDSTVSNQGTGSPYTTPQTAGTFAQAGVHRALAQFKQADITTADGTPRRPVFVFMTDGLPTAATDNFSTLSNATTGNNSNPFRNAWQSDFMTQLTIAYAKEEVRQYYNPNNDPNIEEPLFYSLGFDWTQYGLSLDVLDPEAASIKHTEGRNLGQDRDATSTDQRDINVINKYPGIIDKIDITEKIETAWEELCTNNSYTFKSHVATTNSAWIRAYDSQVTHTVRKVDGFPNSPEDRFYTDGYYYADTVDGLTDAFNQIVLDISIQQSYIPTLVQGASSLSGKVSFVDQIGEYMEVLDVRGIVLNGEMYDGEEMARNFDTTGTHGSVLGTIDGPTALGNYFAEYVGETLGIPRQADGRPDYTTVNEIIDIAYNVGQLSYAGAGDYSHHIAWYADANNQFLGNAHDPGQDCGRANCSHTSPPAGAEYVIRSYLFMGEVNPEQDGVVESSNLMYATVMVREDLEDGTETMIASLPASLIPIVDYEIGLDQYDNIIRFEVGGATSPASIIYEVGLDKDVDVSHLVEQIEAGEVQYEGYDPETGQIKFWTNAWESNVGYNSVNTYGYFRPNTDNDRYYFTEDTVIYDPATNQPYTGATAPYDGEGTGSGNWYKEWYHQDLVYQDIRNADGTFASSAKTYRQGLISDYALSKAMRRSDGTWYIPKGTVQGIAFLGTSDHLIVNKGANATGTNSFVDYPYVDTSTQAANPSNSFVVGAVLGNNGVLVVSPAALEGTKTLEGMALSAGQFTFELYETDSTFTVAEGAAPSCTTTNVAGTAVADKEKTYQGKFTFEAMYPEKLGSNYFVVREQIPEDTQGIYYDRGEYHVTVTLEASGDIVTDIVHILPGGAEDTAEISAVEFYNRTGVALPMTGGSGNQMYMFSGFALILSSSLMYIIIHSKKKRGAA